MLSVILLVSDWNNRNAAAAAFGELLLLDEHTAALGPKSADLVIALTEQVIASGKLTTLMVTHSMHQAASLGDRLIMMHRGQIIHDLQGAEKRRLRPDDLLARFEEVRRAEQLDESASQMRPNSTSERLFPSTSQCGTIARS
ncbi:MAG: hypothetical protein WAJ97_15810 [Terriglobales bacterium]